MWPSTRNYETNLIPYIFHESCIFQRLDGNKERLEICLSSFNTIFLFSLREKVVFKKLASGNPKYSNSIHKSSNPTQTQPQQKNVDWIGPQQQQNSTGRPKKKSRFYTRLECDFQREIIKQI